MAVTIAHNLASLAAQRRLGDATANVSQEYERLSSGLRINKASDDAAGLAIASQLKAGSRVYTQAMRNINDGLSLANVAEGALGNLSQISQRQLELAEQAANGTYSLKQRQALNAEANQLVDEFNRIVGSTKFNGMDLFDPNIGSVVMQAGYGTAETLSVSLSGDLARGKGDGTFGAFSIRRQQSYTFGSLAPSAVTSGDFNGDGKMDYVESFTYASGVIVYYGNGDGSFNKSAFSINQSVNTLTTADVNNDGRLDIITGNLGGSVTVLLNNGNKTFSKTNSTASNTNITSTALGDFNGDGFLDMVAGDGNSRVKVLFGNGNGSFRSAITYTMIGNTTGVAVGDFNGDGKSDIVASTYNGRVSVLLSAGNGTFQAPVSYSVGAAGSQVVVGDFNSDGVDDFAVGMGGRIAVGLGNGNGTFKATISYLASGASQIASLQIYDTDGDGRLDLVAGGSGGVVVSLMGNGDGTFAASRSTSIGEGIGSVTVGDFNGDGKYDTILTTSSYYNYAGNYTYYSTSYIAFGNGTTTNNEAYLNIATQGGARAALGTIQDNMSRIQTQIGRIGAATSRLQFGLGAVGAKQLNYEAAAGRIMDADIADESARLASSQIIQQAAASVLSHANLEPQLALKLLSG